MSVLLLQGPPGSRTQPTRKRCNKKKKKTGLVNRRAISIFSPPFTSKFTKGTCLRVSVYQHSRVNNYGFWDGREEICHLLPCRWEGGVRASNQGAGKRKMNAPGTERASKRVAVCDFVGSYRCALPPVEAYRRGSCKHATGCWRARASS